MAHAERRSGLSHWGERDFLPRLELWLKAIDDDRGLSAAGRAQAEAFTFEHAIRRLQLEALIARRPEIERLELEPPVVVTGLPRSGTTALARSLAKQAQLRWLPRWEALRPFSGCVETRARARARAEHVAVQGLVPRLAELHDCSEDAFVDDTELQCLAFGSYALEWHAHVPAWRDFYLSSDQEPVYRYLKRAMQALSFLRGSRRWLLKSPQHMEQLPALRAVFPGAELFVTSRPVEQCLASMANVMDALAGVFRSSPYPETYWRARFQAMLQRYEHARAA